MRGSKRFGSSWSRILDVLGLVFIVALAPPAVRRANADNEPFPNNRCEVDNVSAGCPAPGDCAPTQTYYCVGSTTWPARWCVPMLNHSCNWTFDRGCDQKRRCDNNQPVLPIGDCTEKVDWCPTQAGPINP